MSSKQKARIRFSADETVMVLREVVYYNPYKNNEKWVIITNAMRTATKKQFTERGIKDHVDYEYKIWNRNNNDNLKK